MSPNVHTVNPFENKWAQFMFARSFVPMSNLGDRIREAANECATVEKLAELSGIPRRTLYNYLKGPREPKAAQLAAIASATGVTLEWLITGQLPKFRHQVKILQTMPLGAMSQSQHSSASIDNPTLGLRRRILRDVTAIYAASGLALKDDDNAVAAMDIMLTLSNQVRDMTDAKEVELALAQLLHNLKRDLAKAAAEPGSGKRSAS